MRILLEVRSLGKVDLGTGSFQQVPINEVRVYVTVDVADVAFLQLQVEGRWEVRLLLVRVGGVRLLRELAETARLAPEQLTLQLVVCLHEGQHVASHFGAELEGYRDEGEESEVKYLIFALALALESLLVTCKG